MLYLLRHGETVWNREGRLQGHLDSPLTPRGIEQARTQRKILNRLPLQGCEIWCSPLGRAVQTAQIALGSRFDAVQYDRRLREIDPGEMSGTLIPGRYRADPAALYHWHNNAPGGEGFAALGERTRAFLHDLRRPAVIIGHGVSLAMLLDAALKQDPAAQSQQPALQQGVVYIVADKKYTILSHSTPESA